MLMGNNGEMLREVEERFGVSPRRRRGESGMAAEWESFAKVKGGLFGGAILFFRGERSSSTREEGGGRVALRVLEERGGRAGGGGIRGFLPLTWAEERGVEISRERGEGERDLYLPGRPAGVVQFGRSRAAEGRCVVVLVLDN